MEGPIGRPYYSCRGPYRRVLLKGPIEGPRRRALLEGLLLHQGSANSQCRFRVHGACTVRSMINDGPVKGPIFIIF